MKVNAKLGRVTCKAAPRSDPMIRLYDHYCQFVSGGTWQSYCVVDCHFRGSDQRFIASTISRIPKSELMTNSTPQQLLMQYAGYGGMVLGRTVNEVNHDDPGVPTGRKLLGL
jgi:hypothetical protein